MQVNIWNNLVREKKKKIQLETEEVSYRQQQCILWDMGFSQHSVRQSESTMG